MSCVQYTGMMGVTCKNVGAEALFLRLLSLSTIANLAIRSISSPIFDLIITKPHYIHLKPLHSYESWPNVSCSSALFTYQSCMLKN